MRLPETVVLRTATFVKVFPELEVHHRGVALVPSTPGEEGAASAASAMLLLPEAGERLQRSCTCALSKRKTCEHQKELSRRWRAFDKQQGKIPFATTFAASIWYRLAYLCWEEESLPCSAVRVQWAEGGKDAEDVLVVTRQNGSIVARDLDSSPARLRLLERTGKAPEGFVDRGQLLERLALFQVKEQERLLAKKGFKSRRQSWEESFWYRVAYHCVREYGGAGRFHPAVDRSSGDFTLRYELGEERPIVQVTLPRPRVKAALALLARQFPEQEDLQLHPVPLRSLFHVSQATDLDLEVRPMIEAMQEDGEAHLVAREDLVRFRYGDLFYLPDLGVLAELEKEGKERKFQAPRQMRLAKSQVPSFLAQNAEALAEGTLVLDEPLRGLSVKKSFDRLELRPQSIEDDGYSLSIRYGFGDQSVSMADVLRARAEKLPYLETEKGWIDVRSPAFDHLEGIFGRQLKEYLSDDGDEEADSDEAHPGEASHSDAVRLTLSQLLYLRAGAASAVEVTGDHEAREQIDRLFALRPAEAYRQPPGLTSLLRPYQVLGVEWLSFLWENRLAGLLCDDMGLGKTHQAMALMASLRHGGVEEPFLVVCPTSVLSHWRTKIQNHAPGLEVEVHHGSQRDLQRALKRADVLVTSYGVLLRDVEALKEVTFALAVFDEVQQLKNQATLSYEAAVKLGARMKVGLTGTPIENRLADLKALFDLLLPGYLGRDSDFHERYGRSELDPRSDRSEQNLENLRNVTAPFILRRMKSAVLDELPPKIEDVQTCFLSDQQVKLYRDVVAQRGTPLTQSLEGEDGESSVPYIHIFAVLNYLKQICDHPALVLKDLDNAEQYRSGKWDLYLELLGQSLASGQKVVVFSQFLGMIELMARHLEGEGIGHAVLTGSSSNRGELIRRFNEDEDCKVFIGSLKAGGTGIDLLGGSVVIHYDRWWNAAREDQATDRVYRIGQKKTVQVFKLVTEGTLEERIAAIIDRKRELLDTVVQEDDPTLSKIFSREELLELLRPV